MFNPPNISHVTFVKYILTAFDNQKKFLYFFGKVQKARDRLLKTEAFCLDIRCYDSAYSRLLTKTKCKIWKTDKKTEIKI